MPHTHAVWQEFAAEFGPPVALVATENDCSVDWKAELLSQWPDNKKQ